MGSLFEIAVIFILTIANGFFAASEIAVVSARRGRLEQRAQAGHRGAAVAIELSENPDRFLSTVQVGITLISTVSAAFGGERLATPLSGILAANFPMVADYSYGLAFALVVALLSYTSLIIGELVPKRLALAGAEAIAAAVAPIMRTIARVGSPIVSFLNFSANLVLRLLGRSEKVQDKITEDDILALVREGATAGTVEDAEHAIITKVFNFSDRSVRSLMTPRTQITAIDGELSTQEALAAVVASGYSRLPVYENSLDTVLGVLYVKDVLQALVKGQAADIRTLLRPAVYVPEPQKAAEAFAQLRQSNTSIALVLDEYGQVSGLVTLEDLVEALVGEIDDEFDERDEAVVRRDDGSYLVDGLLPFSELAERVSLPNAAALREVHDFETTAGFVLALLGRIPAAGDHVVWNGWRFEVMDMDGRRIDKLLIKPLQARPAEV